MSSKTFPRNPLLSNSKFETYKLSHPKVSTSSITLPGAPVTQARVQHGKTTLSAHEVGSRIRHDHLQKCFGGWLGWVDEYWEMWAMKLKTVGSGSFSTFLNARPQNADWSSPVAGSHARTSNRPSPL